MTGHIIPTVGALIIHNGQVLLVRHNEGAGHITGVYGLPAGRIDAGETAEAAALRELQEETGLSSALEHLTPLDAEWTATISTKSGDKTFSLKVFLCKKFWGELAISSETTPEWIDLEKISEHPLLPNVKEIIETGAQL